MAPLTNLELPTSYASRVPRLHFRDCQERQSLIMAWYVIEDVKLSVDNISIRQFDITKTMIPKGQRVAIQEIVFGVS